MAKNNMVKAGDMDTNKFFDALLGEGFNEIRLERTVWKAETGVPVVGHIVDYMMIDLEERTWPVYVFVTTRPTKGADRNGDIIDVAAGEEILVTASAQIAPVLNRYSRDAHTSNEIAVLPNGKENIGGGKTMWTYRIAVGKAAERKGELTLRSGAELGKLTNGQTFDTKTGEVFEAHAQS